MKYNISLRILAALLLLMIIVPYIIMGASSSMADAVYRTQPDAVFIQEEELDFDPIAIPILFKDIVHDNSITYSEATSRVGEVLQYINKLENEVESCRYTEEAVQEMTAEIVRLRAILSSIQQDINKFSVWMDEYPVATEVWFYFRSHGISEEVTAGIIGNMMAECGGLTLKLVPDIYGKEGKTYYYGLCQWSLYYSPQVDGMNTEEQLDHLMRTIEKEFNTFGFCYQNGFTYEDFLSLESPEEASLAFAKVYERCASFSYKVRKQAARTAYNYFTGVE